MFCKKCGGELQVGQLFIQTVDIDDLNEQGAEVWLQEDVDESVDALFVHCPRCLARDADTGYTLDSELNAEEESVYSFVEIPKQEILVVYFWHRPIVFSQVMVDNDYRDKLYGLDEYCETAEEISTNIGYYFELNFKRGERPYFCQNMTIPLLVQAAKKHNLKLEWRYLYGREPHSVQQMYLTLLNDEQRAIVTPLLDLLELKYEM